MGALAPSCKRGKPPRLAFGSAQPEQSSTAVAFALDNVGQLATAAS
jgi:hypothetical protein